MSPGCLILCWEYPPIVDGGLGRHFGRLAPGLADGGVEIHVGTRGRAGMAPAHVVGFDWATVARVREVTGLNI